MSIDIHGFLGPEIHDLETRVIRAFASLGFSAAIHPEMRLLESNPGGCLYLSFTETPPHVGRLLPGAPLLLGFEYGVKKRGEKTPKAAGWPPGKVKQYTYEICTRTSAGRSIAGYFAQALTVAILAKETQGYFYISGDATAVPGHVGLERVQAELSRATGGEFDAEAYPFETWPPMTTDTSFRWPEPIRSEQPGRAEVTGLSRQRRFKFPVFQILGWALVLYFLLATILYS